MLGSGVVARLRQLRRGTHSDYVSTFLATGLIQAIGIVTGVLTARLLGPAGKGDLATVLWLPSLVVVAGILALPQAVAFEASRHPDQAAVLSAAGFWLGLALGLIEAVVLYPLVPLVLGPDKQYLVPVSRVFLLFLPVAFCGLALLGVDQGRQNFARFNLLRFLPAALYLGGILALWWIGTVTVTTVIMVNLLANVITAGIRAAVAGRRLFTNRAAALVEVAEKLIRRGLLFHVPALTGILLMRLDMPFLIRSVSATDVGYYTVATSVAIAQIAVSTSLVQVSFPKVAASASREAGDILSRQVGKAWLPITLTAVVTALLSPLIIRLLFGSEFMPALPAAIVLTAAMGVWGINQVLDNGLRGMGNGSPGALANGLGILVLIVAATPLISLYGILGMAIDMLAAQIGVLVILWSRFRHLSSARGGL
jgi:O-antigen/teichoic acid export membrane protein